MALGFVSKVRIFARSWNILKNWYLYPLVYFNLIKKSHVIFETKSGLKLKIRTGTTDLMVLTNVWLIQEYLHEEFDIKNNHVVLDIGAHIGLFALFASQFCKKGKIFCFEPIKENYDLLLENLELNSIQNIVPFNLAVYHDSKKVKMYINADEAGHSIFLPSSKSIQVNSISLKKIFDSNKIDPCDFAKIDCEGSEYSIIDSLPLEYLKRIKKMAIEYHFADSKPELSKNLILKIKNVGFHVKKKSHYNDMGFLYARK